MYSQELLAGDWDHYREVVLLLIGGLVVFLVFHFLDHTRWFGHFFRRIFPGLQMDSLKALSEKAGGLLWLGLVPLLLFGVVWPFYPLQWLCGPNSMSALWWFLALVPLPVIIAFWQSGNPKHQQQYPQVREPIWSKRLLRVDLLVWVLYLLGYEAFFRGFLLFGLLEHGISPWLAISINTVFYSLAHIPKGKGEALGAIPLGILLCMAALATGSFWVPFGVHAVMAFSNEVFTLRHHPAIRSPLSRNLP